MNTEENIDLPDSSCEKITETFPSTQITKRKFSNSKRNIEVKQKSLCLSIGDMNRKSSTIQEDGPLTPDFITNILQANKKANPSINRMKWKTLANVQDPQYLIQQFQKHDKFPKFIMKKYIEKNPTYKEQAILIVLWLIGRIANQTKSFPNTALPLAREFWLDTKRGVNDREADACLLVLFAAYFLTRSQRGAGLVLSSANKRSLKYVFEHAILFKGLFYDESSVDSNSQCNHDKNISNSNDNFDISTLKPNSSFNTNISDSLPLISSISCFPFSSAETSFPVLITTDSINSDCRNNRSNRNFTNSVCSPVFSITSITPPSLNSEYTLISRSNSKSSHISSLESNSNMKSSVDISTVNTISNNTGNNLDSSLLSTAISTSNSAIPTVCSSISPNISSSKSLNSISVSSVCSPSLSSTKSVSQFSSGLFSQSFSSSSSSVDLSLSTSISSDFPSLKNESSRSIQLRSIPISKSNTSLLNTTSAPDVFPPSDNGLNENTTPYSISDFQINSNTNSFNHLLFTRWRALRDHLDYSAPDSFWVMGMAVGAPITTSRT